MPRDGPDGNASSSGSGHSSPHHEGTVGATPSAFAGGKSSDLDFAVEDVDMWDMILALDGAPLP